jgi:phosphohistidine swiveling domain-containing protein
MSTVERSDSLRFEPPGPGHWEQDPVHFPRPVTRYFSETHPPAFARGTNEFARFYGMLIDGLKIAYVNQFAYNQLLPPPEAEIPQRFARAAEVFETKAWRAQLREWDEERKPASLAAHRAIQSVDPETLPDDELAAYLRRCRDHHSAMLTQHMRFTASAVIPTGDFLAHVGAWTGVPPAELLGLLRGAAPVSAGGSDELERLKTALGSNDAALQLLRSGDDPATVLDRLRALPAEAGAAVSDYLDLVGNRLLDGFDICEPRAIELPGALVRAIEIAVSGEGETAQGVEGKIAEVRSKVPAEHQGEFDELLGEARLTYRLRDERGVYSDIWASGLMRRAALAAGRRVVARGKINDPEHMVDAGLEEMCALVTGSGGPSADELAGRADYRATHTARNAPPTLGPEAPPPPDLSQLPPPIARLMGATMIALGHLFGSSVEEHEEDVLRGLAAARGVYEGPARLISGPAEFGRIANGDVLVTESTTEAFNILLPLLGAIVTDHGGLLSHSAIVAREYGIPGVVGTREATQRIPDGARVRVDGDSGEVTVLA